MDNNNLLLKRRQQTLSTETSTATTNGSINQFRTISDDNNADIEEEMEIKTLTGQSVNTDSQQSFRSSPTVLHFPSNNYQKQRKEVKISSLF